MIVYRCDIPHCRNETENFITFYHLRFQGYGADSLGRRAFTDEFVLCAQHAPKSVTELRELLKRCVQ